MSAKLNATLYRFALAAFLSLSAASATSAAGLPSGCTNDGTIQACVVSASLVKNNDQIVVAYSLEITNKTQFPIGLAFHTTMTFMPENSPPLDTRYFNPRTSGVRSCQNCATDTDPFTTFVPGQPTIISISFETPATSSYMGLLQSAQTATISATYFVKERTGIRRVALSVPRFKFGNGLR